MCKIESPALQSVDIVVLTVSTRVRIILHSVAATDANTVFASAGRSFNYLFDLRSAKMPAFATVSKSRDRALDERYSEALVVSRLAAVGVERPGRTCRTSALRRR